MNILRSVSLLALASAGLSAQAVAIDIRSSGFTDFTTSTVVITESVTTMTGGFGPLSFLNATVQNGPFPISGMGTYTGTGGSLSFDFTFVSVVTDNQGFQTVSGNWTMTGGTGSYAGRTGSGEFVSVVDVSSLGLIAPSESRLTGNVSSVPGPLAALPFALMALKRRKRA